MEPNDHEAISLTPTAKTYNEGDFVHVFQGTAAYVRGRNTVSFIGRVVGYKQRCGSKVGGTFQTRNLCLHNPNLTYENVVACCYFVLVFNKYS